MKNFITTLAILMLTFTTKTTAENLQLHTEILAMDKILFDAFNQKNLSVIKQIFDKDLEFYHDQGGLTNYQQTITNSEKLFVNNHDLSRKLIPNSSEIYPIPNYGAIQTGEHEFCHTENGQPDCGTFKFLHVWKKNEDSWTITRVISYGH